jgi:hypothetical protein
MGIGLNLCRSIVESHRGRMQAENIYNGSEVIRMPLFTFWIPVAKPAWNALGPSPVANQAGSDEPTKIFLKTPE